MKKDIQALLNEGLENYRSEEDEGVNRVTGSSYRTDVGMGTYEERMEEFFRDDEEGGVEEGVYEEHHQEHHHQEHHHQEHHHQRSRGACSTFRPTRLCSRLRRASRCWKESRSEATAKLRPH